jgi:hypothetical protein
MNISEFKEKTKHLDPKTKVMVSCFASDYIKEHLEEANAFELGWDGSLGYRDSHDPSDAPSLADFYKLPEDETISIDIEDGFSFSKVKETLFLNNLVILS